MEVITPDEVISYLGAGTPVESGRLNLIVGLTNGLITDRWANPTMPPAPVPAWVRSIALEVAARPLRNPGGLASVTRSIDDASRTERLSDTAARAGVFLTPEEDARLANRGSTRRRGRYGTIRLRIG